MSIGLVDTATRLHKQRGGKIPRGHRVLLRSVHGNFTSSRGFRWPFPGGEAVAGAPVRDWDGPCPSVPGDGLCLGKTWTGIASGGIPASTLLLCSFRPSDVLGGNDHKVRVARARVLDVFTFAGLLAEASDDERAYLAGANLARANLARANLAGADLAGAYLAGANLADAYLARANLARADLAGANLAGANLARANLAGANLAGANLARADLAGAYLAGAYLAGAHLARAYLARADLAGANLAGAYLARAIGVSEVDRKRAVS